MNNAKVERVIQLTREIVPDFDRKVQSAVQGIKIGSATAAQQLGQMAMDAMREKQNLPQAKELMKIAQEL